MHLRKQGPPAARLASRGNPSQDQRLKTKGVRRRERTRRTLVVNWDPRGPMSPPAAVRSGRYPRTARQWKTAWAMREDELYCPGTDSSSPGARPLTRAHTPSPSIKLAPQEAAL